MSDLASLKKEVAVMSQVALKMLKLTHEAFMEHDAKLIAQALEEEDRLNLLEKEITTGLIEFGRTQAKPQERLIVVVYTDTVGDLELIGDYCKDILERVEIKIAEKLLFSEEAVAEYNELYGITENALAEIAKALEKNDFSLLHEVLKKEEHIDGLVDVYRMRHNQRMIDGVCSPMACNMFLNILDFTAAIYYHTKKIARNLLKIKA